MAKCLIIDSMHDSILQKLKDANFDVEYHPDMKRAEVLDCVDAFDILVLRSKTAVDKELIDRGNNLKYVARAGAGIDNMDLEYMRSKGIEAINAPEGNKDAVGEHTVGMLLVLLNKIHINDRKVRHSIWDREGGRGTELQGKTVGIIGYGNMGKAFATRLLGFGCNVVAYDKYKKDYSDQYVKAVSLDELCRDADIISLHVPLTEETKYMVNEDFINGISKSIYLVNMARGEVASMKDIVHGLGNGKILGAALDVLECEELDRFTPEQKKYFNILSASDKVLLAPHVGGWSYESYQKISEVLAEKIVERFR